MTNLNQDMSAAYGPQSKDDGYRYWPDVGQTPIAYFVRENLQAFMQRFEGLPAGVLLQQLSWVTRQLHALETASTQVEVAHMCKPDLVNENVWQQEIDRLSLEAQSPVWRELMQPSAGKASN